MAGKMLTCLFFKLVGTGPGQMESARVRGRMMRWDGLGRVVGLQGREFRDNTFQLTGKSLTCFWTGKDCIRAVEFHQCWRQGPAVVLMLRWEVEDHGMCPGDQGLATLVINIWHRGWMITETSIA